MAARNVLLEQKPGGVVAKLVGFGPNRENQNNKEEVSILHTIIHCTYKIVSSYEFQCISFYIKSVPHFRFKPDTFYYVLVWFSLSIKDNIIACQLSLSWYVFNQFLQGCSSSQVVGPGNIEDTKDLQREIGRLVVCHHSLGNLFRR